VTDGTGAADPDIASDDTLPDHLRELEVRLLDPAVRASRSELEALLAPEFREFASTGEAYDRQQIVELLADEKPAERVLSDFRVALLAPGVVLVTYHCRKTAKNAGVVVNSIRSSVWRLDGGAWRMVFNQGTRVS